MRKFIIVASIFLSIVLVVILYNVGNDRSYNDEEYKITFIATGDALIHSNIYEDAKTETSYDFKPMLKLIEPIISRYDLAFYNQETIFAGENLTYSNYPIFNTPSEFGDAMIDAGFNMVSLANNHSFDKGEQGILNAIDYWNQKNILWQGINNSLETQETIPIMEKNNISYALLSYTTFTNGNINSKDYLINYYSYNRIKKDIESIRDKVDVIIVSIHWGDENLQIVSEKQKLIAEELAGLKVNIVIGHHPHVLQPITKINDTIVMYSLGNFISDQNEINQRVGALVSLDISKEVNKKEINISINNLSVELIYTYKSKSYKNYLVVPFSMMESKYLKNSEKIYNDNANIITSSYENIKIEPINKN